MIENLLSSPFPPKKPSLILTKPSPQAPSSTRPGPHSAAPRRAPTGRSRPGSGTRAAGSGSRPADRGRRASHLFCWQRISKFRPPKKKKKPPLARKGGEKKKEERRKKKINIPSPKTAMILFNAPPTSRRIKVSVVARPVGSAGFSWRFASASSSADDGSRARFSVAEEGRDFTDAVVSTTRALMEAMAAVKVLPALTSSTGDDSLLKAAAVESRGRRGKGKYLV